MKFSNYKVIQNTLLALVVFTLIFPSQLLFAQTMSSSNFKVQADSVNFGGNRSSSASYKVEDTQGEVGAGEVVGTNYNGKIGYQQMVGTTTTSSPTPTTSSTPTQTVSPSTNQSGSTVLTNVQNFKAEPFTKSIVLSWINPNYTGFESVVLVRSDNFFPSDITDGEIIFAGKTQSFEDTNIIIGKVYYYSIFARDTLGNYSSGALVQSHIRTKAQQESEVLVPVYEDPFENIEVLTNVDPGFANLALLDFDFFQGGRKLENVNNSIIIDGKQTLQISLDYTKVPELLKTIAITLVDPQDPTLVFPFLLKVNKDKTAYEANLAPLGKNGKYAMKIIVLDYKNKGLKRLEGDLQAVVFQADTTSGFNINKYLSKNRVMLVTILIMLLILALIRYKIRNRNNHEEY